MSRIIAGFLYLSIILASMSISEAEAKAQHLSIEYNTVMYVIEDRKGHYAVISEHRYCERGLEDKPIKAIYDHGNRI
jgi:hypothetical protein